MKIPERAQVIITGKRIREEQAEFVKNLVGQDFCVVGWLGSDGTIGHRGALMPNVSFEKFKSDWTKLIDCLFLDVGITIMSGAPGTSVMPLASFKLKDGSFKRAENPHMLHPPPCKIKNSLC